MSILVNTHILYMYIPVLALTTTHAHLNIDDGCGCDDGCGVLLKSIENVCVLVLKRKPCV